MSTLLYLYIGTGLLLSALSVPLILRRIPPNGLYGFRVKATLEDPNLWYAANAYSGWRVLAGGLSAVVAAVGLACVPGLTVDQYALGCLGITGTVLVIGLVRTVGFISGDASMRDEGYLPIDSRRYGPLAFLRKKQWWSFEGLDPRQKIYYVFLALQAIPSDYISLKVIDYGHNRRWTEDHLGSFQAAPGEAVNVSAGGKWGQVHFAGRAEEGWIVEVQTPRLSVRCSQKPQAPAHRNWLLTQHIDYTIQQFVMNQAQGNIQFDGQGFPFSGYGYHEHNWGVQPRHSTAFWLHFWCPDTAGVVLSCQYDAGVPHHYTHLWHRGQEHALYSPAHFTFDPAQAETPWEVHAPDLDLRIRPITAHHSRMQIPPLIAYISTDYYEQLLEVEGTAWVRGQPLSIQGMGKFDFNWNRW